MNRPNFIETENWNQIESNLNRRYEVLAGLSEKFGKTDQLAGKSIELDFIVEKAQLTLTERSNSYYKKGLFLFIIGTFGAIIFGLFLIFSDELFYALRTMLNIDLEKEKRFGAPYDYAAFILRNITASGIILSVIYILLANAISCFRESTILLHRRHSLRSLRVANLNKMELKLEDLEKIFGVNDVMNTGFDRIKSGSIRDNLIGKLIDALATVFSRKKLDPEKDI
jgi:hypothetical protein